MKYMSLRKVLSEFKMTANNINENEKYIPDNAYFKQFVQDAIKQLYKFDAVVCYYQSQVNAVSKVLKRKGIAFYVIQYDDYYVVNKEIIR